MPDNKSMASTWMPRPAPTLKPLPKLVQETIYADRRGNFLGTKQDLVNCVEKLTKGQN